MTYATYKPHKMKCSSLIWRSQYKILALSPQFLLLMEVSCGRKAKMIYPCTFKFVQLRISLIQILATASLVPKRILEHHSLNRQRA